jgi:RimJ/RimL family protein N-acetyltransferase
MDIELRRTTANDLPYVLSAEGDAESRRFIAVWPEEQHRAALDDPNIEHLIIASIPQSQPIGFAILAGLQGAHRSIEFMRIVVTDRGKGYGRAAVRAIKRHAFDTLAAHRLWLDVKEQNTRA